MMESLPANSLRDGYSLAVPLEQLGLPFKGHDVDGSYFNWPSLPELFITSFSGVKTARDDFLVDIDRDALDARVDQYFDSDVSDEELARQYPAAMTATDRYDPESTRRELRSRG